MLDQIIKILNENRAYWPLTDRYVHYQLLNYPVLRHASKPKSLYLNDGDSYGDLCDLLTRARVFGDIDFRAIEDSTRTTTVYDSHAGSGPFIRRELEWLFKGYRRDLQLSQPCHIELILEKLTLRGIVKPVAEEYCIPLTVGRGYASLDPRHKLVQRFKRSCKEKLILLFTCDFDPEGEDIGPAFGRSLRDDFSIPESTITPIKVALTQKQVYDLRLPPRLKAKKDSSRRKGFVEAFGEHVHELESVPAETLQQMIREAIESVLDLDRLQAERRIEFDEAESLKRYRDTARNILLPAIQ